jgi:hypothetical protein
MSIDPVSLEARAAQCALTYVALYIWRHVQEVS